ncbi:TonB-dependent receptor [Exilibacterium tricleocarpae]|uniref:TonB-dependent receptor n=1 Tax=Exilibacterium tricleocarpae TaxID=2591008 RepID=A0A545SPS0_9GAMM|nr:TonB-dependent receptor [Exilibacterium tricleocarpae]TQV66982.1 TonB-dependent receptor [Exilibacterium tricleocarpae]
MFSPEDFFRWRLISIVRPQRRAPKVLLSGTIVGKKSSHLLLTVTVLALCMAGLLSGPTKAEPVPAYKFDIARQSVETALEALATQVGVLLLFPYDPVLSVDANAVKGVYSVRQALDILLQGTGLSGDLTEGGVITVSHARSDRNLGKPMNSKKTKKSFFSGLTALFAAIAAANQAAGQNTENTGLLIEEIVVTAQKREQSLQDTAMSVSALGTTEIERRNLVSMDDYLSTIPGVNVAAEGVGINRITIRGVRASGSEDSTVGVFFGEVPLNTVINGSAVDMKMVDLNRVEILRGPQGTLFGSGSMSGAVRSIPEAPNLERLEGSLEAGFSSTAESGGSNNETVGVLNLPLIQDKLALRMVAYRFDNSGFIDNVAASDPDAIAFAETFGVDLITESGIGSSEYTGGRVSMLWKPTDALAVTFIQAWQELEQNEGFQNVNLDLDDYQAKPVQIGSLNGGDQFRDDEIQLSSLVIEYDFGWGTLLSSTSKTSGGGLKAVDLASGALGLALVQVTDEDRDLFAQEVRFVSSWDSPFQLLAGVYYEEVEQVLDSDAPWYGDLDAIGIPFGGGLGTDPNDVFHEDSVFTNDQTAVFSELSYQLNEQFKVTVGGRWFDYERRENVLQSGALGSGIREDQRASEKDISFKSNLSYTPTDDLLFYAQWAQGFRIGAPVTPAPAATCDRFDAAGNPGPDGFLDGTNITIDNDSVEPDELDNYELGAKFSLLNERLQTRLALYRIDWTGLPVSVRATPDCGFSVLANAGEARIEGVELELSYYITDNWKFDLGLSSSEAELTQDSSLGEKGTRLPGAPELNASLGLEFSFKLAGNAAFARANYAYVDKYRDDIGARFTEAGGYHKLDTRAGVSLNAVDVSLYATNLLNENALTSVVGDPTLAFQMRPRTIGVDVKYLF